MIALFFTLSIGIPAYKVIMNPYRIMKRAFATMNIDKLNRAIERGVDVNRAIKNVAPVVLALRHGRYDFLETICKAGAELNLRNTKGVSLAGQVAATIDTTALDILGKYGADFHAKADTFGRNVLTAVLVNGQHNLVPLALKYTKRNQRDKNGKPPLHYADHFSTVTIQHLVEAGESVNAADAIGNTPMHTVKSLPAVKALHQLGADMNAVNDCLVPALFYQVGNGNGRVYHYMLKNGVEVDRTDDYGHTILTYAMMTDNELLHRQVTDNYCEFYPANCQKAKKHLQNAGIKGLATVIYTKTVHQAVLRRLAATQAAKSAAKRAAMRGAAKRVFWKWLPIIGWISAAYDVAQIADAATQYDQQMRAHREEAQRLRDKRRAAQEMLREQFLTCNVQYVKHFKADTTAVN